MKNTSNVIAGIPMLKCGKQRSTGLYRELFDCLQSYNPYQEGRGAFYDSAAAYNEEGIRKLLDIYTPCKRLEEEAEVVIVIILSE